MAECRSRNTRETHAGVDARPLEQEESALASHRSSFFELRGRTLHRRNLFASLAGGAVLLGMTGCAYQTHRVRYELKIVVIVDGERREGSSVIEVEFTDLGKSSLRPPEMPRVSARSWGEAVVIDLGKHGLLFGLLGTSLANSSNFNVNHVDDVFVHFLPSGQADYGSLWQALPSLSGEFELRPQDRPALVRFTRINDPASAQAVDPSSFASVYGPGASFVKATIGITQKEVTKTIDGHLPWLRRQPPGTLIARPSGVPRSQAAMSARINPLNFKRNGD